MSEQDIAVMALVLGAASLLGAVLGRREGNDRRDVRLMMGFGAALSGVGMLIFSIARA